MINIKDINNKKLPSSEDYLKKLSNLEKDKICGGRWCVSTENCVTIKVWVS